jgi:hypothetical protein
MKSMMLQEFEQVRLAEHPAETGSGARRAKNAVAKRTARTQRTFMRGSFRIAEI